MLGTDARFVRTFVETLNRQERCLLMLRYAESLTAAEIGMVLDLPERTVSQMLEDLRTRARSALAELAPA